jgi:hypothetical protein
LQLKVREALLKDLNQGHSVCMEWDLWDAEACGGITHIFVAGPKNKVAVLQKA